MLLRRALVATVRHGGGGGPVCALTATVTRRPLCTRSGVAAAAAFLPPPLIACVPSARDAIQLRSARCARLDVAEAAVADAEARYAVAVSGEERLATASALSATRATVAIARRAQRPPITADDRRPELVRDGLRALLATRCPPHRPNKDTRERDSIEEHEVEQRWRSYAASLGLPQSGSFRAFRSRFLRPRRIELDWHLSPDLPSARSEALMAAHCRPAGDFLPSGSSPSVRRLNKPRWDSAWAYRYGDTPEPLPPPSLKRSMAEVLVRDAVVLRSAPLLLEPMRQQEVYIAFHDRLREALQVLHDREHWALTKQQLRQPRTHATPSQPGTLPHWIAASTIPTTHAASTSAPSGPSRNSSPLAGSGLDVLGMSSLHAPEPQSREEIVAQLRGWITELKEQQRLDAEQRADNGEEDVDEDENDEDEHDDLGEEYEEDQPEEQEEVPPPAPFVSTRVPRTAESLRRSNASFFARLASSSTSAAPLVSPLGPSPLSQTLPVADSLRHFSPETLTTLQARVAQDFCVEWDIPPQLLRRILDLTDTKVQRQYDAIAAEETSGSSPSAQLDDQSLSMDSMQDVPPLPSEPHPLHARIHSRMVASNPCYAATGGLARSMGHVRLSRPERAKARSFLTHLLLAVHRSTRQSQVGRDVLLHGFAAQGVHPNAVHPEPATGDVAAQYARDQALASQLRSERWERKQEYLAVVEQEKKAARASQSSAPNTQPTNEQSPAVAPSPPSAQPPTEPAAETTVLLDDDADQLEDVADENEVNSVTLETEADLNPVDSPSSPSSLSLGALKVEVGDSGRSRIQQKHASQFERAVRDLLDTHGVRYVEESWLVQQPELRSSPDILLLDDVWLRIHAPQPDGTTVTRLVQVRWLEMKAMYGACLQYAHPSLPVAWPSAVSRGWLEQCERYIAAFGPGAVIFENHFCREWLQATDEALTTGPTALPPSRLPSGVSFLDLTNATRYQPVVAPAAKPAPQA